MGWNIIIKPHYGATEGDMEELSNLLDKVIAIAEKKMRASFISEFVLDKPDDRDDCDHKFGLMSGNDPFFSFKVAGEEIPNDPIVKCVMCSKSFLLDVGPVDIDTSINIDG